MLQTPHPSFKFFLEFEIHLLRQEKATEKSARLDIVKQCKFVITFKWRGVTHTKPSPAGEGVELLCSNCETDEESKNKNI